MDLIAGETGLVELALDQRSVWNHDADRIWQRIDPALWETTRNPWLILQTIGKRRSAILESDAGFRELVDATLERRAAELRTPGWFARRTDRPKQFLAAYFSMEFGLSEALPIYAGGLGVLAGDLLKTASDLDVPLVGVGLLYRRGYFRQALNAAGAQIELYPANDPNLLPIADVRDRDGELVRIALELPGRTLFLRAWMARVGRTTLYLLDSNDPENGAADRGVTADLYGDGTELRLLQELCLGIGGWRLLRALELDPDVCHLNEGHPAFAVLERARDLMDRMRVPFAVAWAATRAGNAFTTHTPVDAAFDRFPPELIGQYLGAYVTDMGLSLDDVLALGRAPADRGAFTPSYLAVRGSAHVNAVSRVHRDVSREMFAPLFARRPYAEVPVDVVTNGVHAPTWDSQAADDLWTGACGKNRWRAPSERLSAAVAGVDDDRIWAMRNENRRRMVDAVRAALARQLAVIGAPGERIAAAASALDPTALTIGFGRRFTAYKRNTLLLTDPERLARMLADSARPVQLVVAGKAHPADADGKAMVRAWVAFTERPDVRGRAVFVADYDLRTAETLAGGTDLWINTPRRPWEACGTSGMKTLVNGGLNFSELDGWWAEAYRPEVGWAIGDGSPDLDSERDAREATEVYERLENEIVREFYDRDAEGRPRAWLARIRASMATLTPEFSTVRVLRDYIDRMYLPAAASFRGRIADGAREAKAIVAWEHELTSSWAQVRFEAVRFAGGRSRYDVTIEIALGDIEPDAVAVELYAEARGTAGAELHRITEREPIGDDCYRYRYALATGRSPDDYTARVVPYREGVGIPSESGLILWQR